MVKYFISNSFDTLHCPHGTIGNPQGALGGNSVAQRHQMVSGSLALLKFCWHFYLHVRPSICPFVHPSVLYISHTVAFATGIPGATEAEKEKRSCSDAAYNIIGSK